MNLDDALRQWAAQEVELPAPVTDDIFRRIVAAPQPLDPRWWSSFSGRLAATVVASTRPRVPARWPSGSPGLV
ncbi:hypothetical protein [Paractinoplanes brasiliensis]|uniref:Uncharacterized protein n=1 Tax=Paractinoplanes brasiliensis TaxID=52695 RepID=A0A4R6J9I5_9ACTN|nr:hypothetical protein [Actinoplanes brasiliensis]TDO31075.1 hypothetical protein C8E87_6485 [Actinoplanes brasiliensis]GID33291.1 hypothetical protein Abr02nite_82740 [Actinoplanes brasiliensis]